ncbi:hypothetical protein MMC25_004674 [Agyrium rufum]|nr:hypothetical protein [Agyrium rufum]
MFLSTLSTTFLFLSLSLAAPLQSSRRVATEGKSMPTNQSIKIPLLNLSDKTLTPSLPHHSDLAARGDTAPVMAITAGNVVPFDSAGVVARGDTEPVMAITAGDVVPFDSAGVVARGDTEPVMAITAGDVVPFDSAGVVA